MFKDLALVPRSIYTLVLSVGIIFAAPFSIQASITNLLFAFGMSFMWQYLVVDFALRRLILEKRPRLFFLLGWFTVSTLLGLSAAYFVSAFDFGYTGDGHDAEALTYQYALLVALYFVAVGMFVAGACARRTWWKYL